MTRRVTLESAGGSIVLGRNISGVSAGLKMRGTGMPPVQVQWFEGAGDGASFRGGRTLPRILDMPITVRGADRQEVWDRASQVARIMALENAPVTLTMDLDGEAWRLQIVRTGGGDWDWEVDTDGSTFVKQIYTVQAGMPFWERVDPESRLIQAGGLGIGLLDDGQSLTQLRLSNMEASGSVNIENTGDVRAWPIWKFSGPLTSVEAIRGDGQKWKWTGTLATTAKYILLNTQDGTVIDDLGANRYAGLDTAPKFWSVPPGTTPAQITMTGADTTTEASVVWHPRKLLVF